MNVYGLLTSAGINTGICVLFLSLYSILRKLPGNFHVYFGRRFAREHNKCRDSFNLERLIPSPSWMVQAWRSTDDDILQVAGLDAVVFIRTFVFSIRIFSIATVICVSGVLPLNYFGQEMQHSQLPSESMDVFTIGNVKEGSRWFWVHCLALYIISCSACILLYFEYKSIGRMRIAHIAGSPPNPSHFTVLVRAIPGSTKESFTDSVRSFFTKYHASSYLSHQMIYRTGKVQKIMKNAEKVYKKVVHLKATNIDKTCCPCRIRCSLCGGTSDSFQEYSNEYELGVQTPGPDHLDSCTEEKECPAAFVFFKTRYAAVVASQVLQSSNPMLWVTDLAPEPDDVYWSNLWLPYRQLCLRRVGTLLVFIIFNILFLFPSGLVQSLSNLDQLQQRLPFLKGILKVTFVSQLVTGYLPSVILLLFQFIVPPTMMRLSAFEGPISRSGRKKSALCKVLYFTIGSVFLGNVLSGSVINQLSASIPSPNRIPSQLARAVSRQASFFITYVLTSGWTSLSSEVMQLFSLIWNFVKRDVFRSEVDPDSVPSFPYQTDVPRVLLFGLLGFAFSVLAPLILPFLLVYFILGYIVYRNQFLNVYCSKYETGGQLWPIIHNTTIFSLVFAQIIALGVFGLKKSPVAAGFTIPLVICTLIFNEYCRQRFEPIFKKFSAQDLIEIDDRDEQSGLMEEIRLQLHSAYCQFPPNRDNKWKGESSRSGEAGEPSAELRRSSGHPALSGLPICTLQKTITSLAMFITLQNRRLST